MPPTATSYDKEAGTIGLSNDGCAGTGSSLPSSEEVQKQLTRGYFLIPTTQWGSLSSAAQSFFALPDESKQKIAPNGRYGAGGVCFDKNGHEVFYTETVSPAEQLERLVITEPYIREFTTGKVFKDLWSGVVSDAKLVADILARMTGLPATSFMSTTDGSFLRLNRYQAAAEPSKSEFALRPHTDKYSFVVVYSDEDECSLEVMGDDGEWNTVICPRGFAAVILGSATADISNQMLKPGLHKVNRIGLKSRTSINLCINPPDEVYQTFRNVELSCPIVRQIKLNFSVTCVLDHIALLKAVVSGPTEQESLKLPSWKDKTFWQMQIKRYSNYLSLYNRYLDGHIQCIGSFPDPPREIYYCWLVHMLQPHAYKLGCLNAYGRIIPHKNHVPCFDREDELNGLWLDAYGTDLWTWSSYRENNVESIFPLTNWWIGMDGVRAEFEEALESSEELLRGDTGFIEQVIAYYGRYLSLASLNGGVALAPGCAIDIIWHAHQTTPLMYNEVMDMLPCYIDHIPCGEANPADPKWSMNTVNLWKQYFGDDMHSKVVPELDGVGGWCCCSCCSTGESEENKTLDKESKSSEEILNKKKLQQQQEQKRNVKADAESRQKIKEDLRVQKQKKQPVNTQVPKNSDVSVQKQKEQAVNTQKPKNSDVTQTKSVPKNDIFEAKDAPSATPKDSAKSEQLSKSDVLKATSSMKPWGRSKLMIVGDGRAGKTCFSNALVGKQYTETKSTVGIDTMTVDVKFASAGESKGAWSSYKKPEKEYELELAMQLASWQNENKKSEPSSTSIANEENGKSDKVSEVQLSSDVNEAHSYYSKVVNKNKLKISGGGTSLTTAESIPIVNDENPLWSKYSGDYNDSVLDNFDLNCVLKCLHSDVKNATGDLQLSIYDYGGQKVFDAIHQFFLTANGVYAICFSMEWFVEGRDVEQCMSVIDFWVDSITSNTCLQSGTAPVVFVGTHKDKVSDVRIHDKISNMIYERFSGKLLWGNIIPNDRGIGVNGITQYWFYPVDNVGGPKEDVVFQHLMNNVETYAVTSSFVSDKKPIAWLKGIDEIMEKKQPFLKYDEVKEILAGLGSSESEICHFLSFMHENGILMWHEEEFLRDTVIMDPVEFFVKPTTKLIRKFSTSGHDSTTHIDECHRKCMQKANRSWRTLINDGIVDKKIIDILYEDYDEERKATLLALMQKFGIIVPIQACRRQTSEISNSEYLVPPLFKNDDTELFHEEWSDGSQFTLTFSTDDDILNHSTIFLSYIAKEGFMPHTIFDKILGKLFVHWQNVSHRDDANSLSHLKLCKNMAVFFFGCRRFRLRHFEKLNIIVVDIEGNDNPIELYERILSVVNYSLNENTKSLYCTPCLALNKRTKLCMFSRGDFNTSCEDVVLINFGEHERLVAGKSILNKKGCGAIHLSRQDAMSYFCNWMNGTVPSQYDCFLSYRQGLDSDFVTTLFDAIKAAPTASAVMDVFRDKNSMYDGHDFQMQFTIALVNSTVVCPIVSHAALLKMSDHDATSEDNVLIEWIIALVCLDSNDDVSRVKRICPVFIGEVKKSILVDGSTNLFGSKIYQSVPDIIPRTSIETSCELLRKMNVSLLPDMQTWTVKYILMKIAKFLFLCTWEIEDPSTIAIACSEKLVRAIQDANSARRKPDPVDSPNESLIVSHQVKQTDVKALNMLTTVEVKALFSSLLNTDAYDACIDKHVLNGELLSFAECTEDLEELGITMEKIKSRMLLSHLQRFRKEGVDAKLLE